MSCEPDKLSRTQIACCFYKPACIYIFLRSIHSFPGLPPRKHWGLLAMNESFLISTAAGTIHLLTFLDYYTVLYWIFYKPAFIGMGFMTKYSRVGDLKIVCSFLYFTDVECGSLKLKFPGRALFLVCRWLVSCCVSQDLFP